MQILGDLEQMVLKDIVDWARSFNEPGIIGFRTERDMIEAYWAEKLADQGKRPLFPT